MKQTLYKYLSIDGDERLNRALNFINGSAYFSSPNYFNDPFELSPSILPPTEKDVEKIIGNNALSSLNKRHVETLIRSAHYQCDREMKGLSTENWLNRFGVLCLSTDYKSLLMWAHYGDCHKGICIGIDSGSSYFRNAKRVEYTSTRPTIPFSISDHERPVCIPSVFYTKSKDWAYENEWRVVKRLISEEELLYYKARYEEDKNNVDEIAEIIGENSGPGVYEFDPKCVRVIYLGARITESAKSKLLEAIQYRKNKLKVYQLNIDGKYYLLNREKL